MTANTQDPAKDPKSWFVGAFERFEDGLNGEAGTPLHQTRRQAIDRFAHGGLPTTRDEDWNYTNIAPYLRHEFEPAGPEAAAGVGPETLAPFLFEGEGARLVFVDGHYAEALSRPDGLPAGTRLGSLRRVLDDEPETAQRLFGLVGATDGFAALNGAFLRDGAFVALPENAAVEAPVHLLFLSTPGDRPRASFNRALVLAGAGSRATLVETYAGLDGGPYLNNAATEIFLEEGAGLDHVKVQREGDGGLHVGSLAVRQGRGCRFQSTNAILGGRLVRNDLRSLLDGEEVHSTLNGLYVLDGEEHADNHTLIEHAQPNCESHELYKGVLDDASSGAFRGKIHVHPQAQKTDAFQSNQNLVLSDRAEAFAQPQLEIYADDVKCSHGATVGQLDAEALFYLRARGLTAEAARRVLTHAFALEVIERVPVDGLRRRLEELVVAKLERGLRAGGAA